MNTFNAIGYFKGSNNAKLVQSFPSKTGKGEYLKLSFGVSIPEKNIDWIFYRENTEGEYVLGSSGIEVPGKLAFDFKVTTTPGTDYTSNWMRGVAAIGTFVKNKNATWDVIGESGIPEGWNIKTE